MSSVEVSEKRTESNKCTNCGTIKSKDELRSCSRCLSVKYCCRDCQKSDWKRHKKTECKSAKLPPHAVKTLPHAQEEVAERRIRNVIIPSPKNVLCACWCCGMLIARVRFDNALTNNMSEAQKAQQIQLENFDWTSTYGRDAQGFQVERGLSCPALWALGEMGSTGYMLGANENGEALACGFCVKALNRKNGKYAEKHIQNCEDYLCDKEFKEAAATLNTLNVMEKRMISLIAIEHDPNLSAGKMSVAGYFKKKGKKAIRNKGVSYQHRNFEGSAFPYLMAKAKGFLGGSLDELRHYTLMRLYSADQSWRNDPDYVCFSILRLAAYGCGRAKSTVAIWPDSVSLRNGFDETVEIQLLPEFHVDC